MVQIISADGITIRFRDLHLAGMKLLYDLGWTPMLVYRSRHQSWLAGQVGVDGPAPRP